jgi:tRNA threonylcarbamoyladenosine biosynthesis protein TsaB
MILAIDTSTRFASLALYDGEMVCAEETWRSKNSHTVELVPSLVRMLERQGVSPCQLIGIAVALGPGSFTGLRIGLAVAKGFVLALGLPIVGIPTLDIIAHAHPWHGLQICTILQAGRGRICFAFYQWKRGRLERLSEPRIATFSELCSEVFSLTLFCGEIDSQAADFIRENLGELASVASPASSLRRAGYLAEMGWERLKRGESDDPASLSPIYLHREGGK